MVRFREKKITKEKFYAAKNPMKIWDVNADNIVTSKLVKTKTNCKYLIGIKFDKDHLLWWYLNWLDVLRHLKLKRVIKKLLEKNKGIWTKIDYLKNIELNALPVHDDRYIKTKIKTFGDKFYTNYLGGMCQKMI